MLIASVSIDVDVTAIYMGIAFLVFYLAFAEILAKPYLKVREMRSEAVDGSREEAQESEALAEAAFLEFDEAMKNARREAADLRENLRLEGTAEQRDLVEEAREGVQAELAEERSKIAQQVAEAEKQLQERAASLSQAIVDKILPSVG